MQFVWLSVRSMLSSKQNYNEKNKNKYKKEIIIAVMMMMTTTDNTILSIELMNGRVKSNVASNGRAPEKDRDTLAKNYGYYYCYYF